MKIQANQLQVGTIVASGEEVLSVHKIGSFRNVKAGVTLRKPSGATRVASWGWFSTIFVNSVPK